LTMDSGRIRIQDLYYEYEGMTVNRGLFLINLNNGSIRSTAEMHAAYNQVPVSTGFSLAMDYGRSFTLPELPKLSKAGFSGTLATRAMLWNNKQHFPGFTYQFTKDDESFRVQTPDGKTLNASYIFNTGALDIISGDPLPVVMKGGGTIKDGQLNLSFPELSLDPVLINYAMIRDPILLQYHVIFQSGRFLGNLDITGSTSNPLINGEIAAENLQVDTPYTYAAIKPASTLLHFKDHRIDVDRIDIPIGDGIVYASGHIVLDRLKLSDFDMIYGGKGTKHGDGVPVYYPLMGVNLDGVFTGEVHMTGGDKHFSLTGDITFPYLKSALGSALIPVSQVKEGVYPSSVDLDFNFITGKNCIFFLPNEQLKIVKAIAESDQVINLKYSNNPDLLSISGRLPIKSGAIYYFDRDFQISDGELRFNESLGSFDPVLEIRAETKVRDDMGEDVSVALVYNAPIMSDFTPQIETVPPRSELEVMALFGQAVALYSGDQNSDAASTVLLATGGMFGQVGIVQPFEDVLREGLNLDMVTIRTDIIENTIAEGLARGSESKESSGSTGLGRYLDNTSLYAGKYIGDALFISGTVKANYFEEQRLRSVFGGLEFETSVSLEMETPFFNVAWSYSPDSAKNQNFVADNEISLKWQFSF
ncbi:MAG: translocation/assembly module TamB domain-containing protein, partial [Spirochaetaceae bacterium]|nr:translocation/assembly module TamB domain-containing protein [Spirochaetaceae bacterium]